MLQAVKRAAHQAQEEFAETSTYSTLSAMWSGPLLAIDAVWGGDPHENPGRRPNDRYLRNPSRL